MRKYAALPLILLLAGLSYGATVVLDGASIQDNTITSAKLIDNNVNGGKILDNTLNGSKVLDNTLAVGKVSTTGTASNATYLRGDGAWGTPSITTSTEILSSYKGLTITTPADNQSVTIIADQIVSVDNTNAARILSAVSLTVDLDVAGANGLDNGTIAANTGYFLYVIDNGATTAGLASTSATAPIMPATYTYKAIVGWMTTDNTATPFNVEEFTQVDDVYQWSVPQKLVDGATPGAATTTMNLAAGGAKTYAIVPPSIAKSATGKWTFSASDGQHWFLSPKTFADTQDHGNASTLHEFFSAGTLSNGNWTLGAFIESQTFYYQYDEAELDLWLSSFTFKR